ncbi:MAG: Sua5/YciO/YrdC/YwlC family protein [Chthoniobacterales bacterium]
MSPTRTPSGAMMLPRLTPSVTFASVTLILCLSAAPARLMVTAGLETLAVRLSAHPVLTDILHGFGQPVAAPSANRFGRISPTAAAHVLEKLAQAFRAAAR